MVAEKKKNKQRKEKKSYTYRPYEAISILCSIGFIPRQLFVAESKGTKILCLCEFGEKKDRKSTRLNSSHVD